MDIWVLIIAIAIVLAPFYLYVISGMVCWAYFLNKRQYTVDIMRSLHPDEEKR